LDAILGFINANMVVIGFIWGLICKYWPKMSGFPNALIPYATALVTLLTGLAGPATAHAGILGINIGGHTFFGSILGAGWTAIQSALLYEIFARHPLEAMGAKKA